ncbi:MAG: family transcriptional regulator, cyclic receptor protein [Blastocatellia bacterium]|nr:family transcriptional regulator, cyclic receptor protein [Blastocatellia bacterium]
MSTTMPQEMTLDAIRSVPLFASLDDEETRDLRSLLTTRDVAAGTALFRAGDDGDAMYLIETGRVRIAVKDADEKEIVLAELARGDFFGEMAIIDGKKRSADAVIIEPSRLATLSRENFLRFIHGNPNVALEMLSATFSRLRTTDRMLQQRVSRNVNEEQDKRSTLADRMADHLAEFGGSWKFIGFALGIIVSWIVFNSYILIHGFDPLPYQMLNLVMGIIAGLQAPIIMMSQNRQSGKDRLRADLDYQVNLKNELALTEVLRRLDVLESERLPVLFTEQNALIREMKSPGSAGSTSGSS